MVINYLKKTDQKAPDSSPKDKKEAVSPPKIDGHQKKRIEKHYQNKIKEVLDGLVTKDKKVISPAPKRTIKTKEPKAAAGGRSRQVTLTNQNLAKIREAVLKELTLEDKKSSQVPLPSQPLKPHEESLKPKLTKAVSLSEAVSQKPKLISILLKIFLAVVLLFVLLTAGLYLGGWDKPFVQKLTKIIPYPVLYIEGKFISANSFLEDINSLRKYLQRQGASVNDSQLKNQVIKSLIEKQVILDMALREGLSVSQLEVQEQISFIINNSQSIDELENLIKELYGWDMNKYSAKIIRPLLLAQKVEENFYHLQESGKIKEQMENYLLELKKEPDRFSQLAREVNEDNTKYLDGDLGWFSLGDMVPEFEIALLTLEPGEISEVLKTRYGYHLVKLEEKLVDDLGQTTFHARHIFFKRPSFADYLTEQIKKAKVVTLIKI